MPRIWPGACAGWPWAVAVVVIVDRARMENTKMDKIRFSMFISFSSSGLIGLIKSS
jgi:hypothetical protein